MLFLRQLECPPNYTFQFWHGPLAKPIPAKKAHSSLSGANFVTLHFFFFYAVETNKLCDIGVYFKQTCRPTSIEITPF